MQMRLRYHRHLTMATLHLKSVAAARLAVQHAAAPVRVISCKTQCNGPVASCDLNMAFEEQRFTALSTYLSKKVYVALKELLVDKLRQAEEHFFVEPEDLDAQSKTRQDFFSCKCYRRDHVLQCRNQLCPSRRKSCQNVRAVQS